MFELEQDQGGLLEGSQRPGAGASAQGAAVCGRQAGYELRGLAVGIEYAGVGNVGGQAKPLVIGVSVVRPPLPGALLLSRVGWVDRRG